MTKTMEDLRREVASRLRNALNGRVLEDKQHVELPHMLGVTPIGKVHDPHNEEMTLLDSRHQFWDEYHKEINTKRKAHEEIKTAIHLLEQDGIFRMSYPYGEEADIAYIEVDEMTKTSAMETSCVECDASFETEFTVEPAGNNYHLLLNVDCPECGYDGSFGRMLTRN